MTKTAQTALFVVLALLGLSNVIQSVRPRPERVAYVDLNRVSAESEVGKRGAQDIRSWLDLQNQQIRQMMADAKKAADAKAADAGPKQAAADTFSLQTETDLQARRAELGRAVKGRVVAICQRLAADRGFDVILPGDQALVANDDLTAQVISELNKGADVGLLDKALADATAERDQLRRQLEAAHPRADAGAPDTAGVSGGSPARH